MTAPLFLILFVPFLSIFFLTSNKKIVILVGTRSTDIFEAEKDFVKYGFIHISADLIRDKTGKIKSYKFQVIFLILKNLLIGNDVVFSTSSNSKKETFLFNLLFFSAIIRVMDLRETKCSAIKNTKAMSDLEINLITPEYFKHHKSQDFENYSKGADRARAVLLHELQNSYGDERFLPSPLSW